jgi:hypothetical protein
MKQYQYMCAHCGVRTWSNSYRYAYFCSVCCTSDGLLPVCTTEQETQPSAQNPIKCECGACKTSNPNLHSDWCPLWSK